MNLSSIPAKFYKAFASGAASGNIRPIPVTTSDPDAASQLIGWPPPTLTAIGAGGVPPNGLDMNGLDNMLSAWAQWIALGGAFVPYDSTFQSAVGGYIKTAIVGSVTNPGTFWQSTVDNNMTNPDTGGSGWISFPGASSTNWGSPGQIGNVSPNNGTFEALVANTFFNCGGFINSAIDLQINGVGFSQSLGQYGYQRNPGGLITQWGRFFPTSGNGDYIPFNETFPNNCSISMVGGTTSSSDVPSIGVELMQNSSTPGGPPFTGFKVWSWINGSISNVNGISFVAVGN